MDSLQPKDADQAPRASNPDAPKPVVSATSLGRLSAASSANAQSPSSSIDWKEAREWTSIILSVLAFGVSIIGYVNSRTSTQLARDQYDSDRAIIVIGERVHKEDSESTLFKFHALSSTQRLSKLEIMFPKAVDPDPLRSIPPDQELDLVEPQMLLSSFILKNEGKAPAGKFGFLETELPVVLDAEYSVSGVSAERRGLYSLSLTSILSDDGSKPKISFEDFSFVQAINLEDDPQKVIDDLFAKQLAKNKK